MARHLEQQSGDLLWLTLVWVGIRCQEPLENHCGVGQLWVGLGWHNPGMQVWVLVSPRYFDAKVVAETLKKVVPHSQAVAY